MHCAENITCAKNARFAETLKRVQETKNTGNRAEAITLAHYDECFVACLLDAPGEFEREGPVMLEVQLETERSMRGLAKDFPCLEQAVRERCETFQPTGVLMMFVQCT